MIELLTTYTITEMVIFLVMFAVAAKGVISFADWAHGRVKESFHKWHQKEKANEESTRNLAALTESVSEINERLETLSEEIQKTDDRIDEMNDSMSATNNLLIRSNKELLKNAITEKYDASMKRGWIDEHNLECVINMFEAYKEEGGNTFIGKLMDEIYQLPNQPPDAKPEQ